MSIAQFVDFKRTRRGGRSKPGSRSGRRNSARGQAANQRTYLKVIGPRKKKKISSKETNKEGFLK